MKRMVSAPCGEDGRAGGGGSVAFGSITGIGMIGSIFTCDAAGFLARSSATTSGIASATRTRTNCFGLSTHPLVAIFSIASLFNWSAVALRDSARF